MLYQSGNVQHAAASVASSRTAQAYQEMLSTGLISRQQQLPYTISRGHQWIPFVTRQKFEPAGLGHFNHGRFPCQTPTRAYRTAQRIVYGRLPVFPLQGRQ